MNNSSVSSPDAWCVSPGLQAVFLDDLGRNVRGARDVGMSAVRVRDTELALRELGSLLGLEISDSCSSNHILLKSLL